MINMSSNFEFNAPQFINFSDLDDPKADKFFDINVEQMHGANNHSNSKAKVTNKKSESENQDPNLKSKSTDSSSCKKNLPVLRKVLHEIVNQQIQNDKSVEPQSKDQGKDLIENFEKLELSEVKSSKKRAPVKVTDVSSDVKSSGRKSHHMISRLDIMNKKNESKSSRPSLNSQDSSLSVCVNQVTSTQSSRSVSMKRNGSPLHSAKKFISLAEQVQHFYNDTPERYRSKPTKQITPYRSTWVAKPNCVPRTPNLTTRYRARKINFPNQQQREEMELEEIKKHQVKAYPLNEKILQGPCLNLKVPVIKKPITIPQPFSLTEVKKKEPQQEPVFHFKAQPVPTTILQGPTGIPPKKVLSPTVCHTPQIKMPMRYRVEAKTPDVVPNNGTLNLPQKTKVEPFSFDLRMKQMLQKKEEFVKKVLEEEKKTFNSFKAHPMPLFKSKNDQSLKQDRSIHKTIPQPFNLTQPKANKSFSEDQAANTRITPFKARPAAVIHQKPFIPKLEKHEILIPSDFHLNTEKRAAERQKFDEKIKQKEEEYALILKLQKEEEEKLEREKKLEERKKAEFKAKPVPRYKTFEIHGSDPEKLTHPQSPLFSSKIRNAKKENQTTENC